MLPKQNQNIYYYCSVSFLGVEKKPKFGKQREFQFQISAFLRLVPVAGVEPAPCRQDRILSFTIYSVTDRI